MTLFKYPILGIALLCVCAVQGRHGTKKLRTVPRKFPDGFLFGAATASAQVEGAWNEDGKSENIWDRLAHSVPSFIRDGATGDVSDDSYHNVKRDVQMMRELGLDFYRFSISWTRVLPTSFPDKINKAGVAYYNKLINEMLKYNIQPMVTLYHWDLPQKLQDMGGWTNPHSVDWFADYARIVFEAFGDRVKYWITFNEPKEVCLQGYDLAVKAPLLKIPGYADYMCVKYLLLAHAAAYHIYDQEFKPAYGGVVGIALSGGHTEPATKYDDEAAEECMQFEWGIYANPIFSKTGNYPQVVIDKVAAKSVEQGFPRSRLLPLDEDEVDYIRGTADFMGFNYYTSNIAYRNESVVGFYEVPSTLDDIGAVTYQHKDWEYAYSSWLAVHPKGFYRLLRKIRKDYNNPTVMITENGFSTAPEASPIDDRRIQYYIKNLNAMLDAIQEGSNVTAYTIWSLMDNFEWMAGYAERFGLYSVNFSDPARTRTPRKSAFFYKDLLRTRALDYHFDIDFKHAVMTID